MISTVILNWNGKEFLKKCIPSVIKACDIYGNSWEVIIVDNGSSDESIAYLGSNFSRLRIISLKENFGFAKAMNIGIGEARFPVVIGLNNDIIVKEDFISPLTRHFSSGGDIFAVSAKMLLWDGETLNSGKATGTFRFGLFRQAFTDAPHSSNALYASGGGFAVDKNKFLELGGFDEDMAAFWEDIDLCYRAWKRGWKTIYEPESVIYHKSHGTYSKKYGMSGIRKMSSENYCLFILKNIHNKIIFYQQIFLLPLLMLLAVLVGKSHFTIGFLRSIKRWPLFFKKRRIEKKKALFSDREVFRISRL